MPSIPTHTLIDCHPFPPVVTTPSINRRGPKPPTRVSTIWKKERAKQKNALKAQAVRQPSLISPFRSTQPPTSVVHVGAVLVGGFRVAGQVCRAVGKHGTRTYISSSSQPIYASSAKRAKKFGIADSGYCIVDRSLYHDWENVLCFHALSGSKRHFVCRVCLTAPGTVVVLPNQRWISPWRFRANGKGYLRCSG